MTTRKDIEDEDEALERMKRGTQARLEEIPNRTTVFVVGHMPKELLHAWLQHVRDFDTAYPVCHFEISMDGPEESLAEMVDAARVNPELTFRQIFKRGRT